MVGLCIKVCFRCFSFFTCSLCPPAAGVSALVWLTHVQNPSEVPHLAQSSSPHVCLLPPFRYLPPLYLLLCLLSLSSICWRQVLGMPRWLGLCLMPNAMTEIMRPVMTMVSKNQFSWRAEWPRVLVAAKQATGTSALGRPWGTVCWCMMPKREEQGTKHEQ